jgi:hypothetical protein
MIVMLLLNRPHRYTGKCRSVFASQMPPTGRAETLSFARFRIQKRAQAPYSAQVKFSAAIVLEKDARISTRG